MVALFHYKHIILTLILSILKLYLCIVSHCLLFYKIMFSCWFSLLNMVLIYVFIQSFYQSYIYIYIYIKMRFLFCVSNICRLSLFDLCFFLCLFSSSVPPSKCKIKLNEKINNNKSWLPKVFDFPAIFSLFITPFSNVFFSFSINIFLIKTKNFAGFI